MASKGRPEKRCTPRRISDGRIVTVRPRGDRPELGRRWIGGDLIPLAQAYRWTLLVDGRIWGWTTTREDADRWAEELR